jgi:hypothetical protein
MSALVPIVVADPGAGSDRSRSVAVDRSMSGSRTVVGDGTIEATVGRVTVRAASAVDPTWLATLLKSLA